MEAPEKESWNRSSRSGDRRITGMPWNTYWTVIAQILLVVVIFAAPSILFVYVLSRVVFDSFHHSMIEAFASLFARAREAAAAKDAQ